MASTRKRRWDVTDRRLDSTPSNAAAQAAARLNAKLAAEGKITKQDNVILPPPPAIGTPSQPSLLTTPTNTPPFTSTQTGHVYIQEKVFAGLDDAPPGFNVAERLQGPGNAYLTHITTQTGAKVFLRGRGSGYLEPTSGRESFEALHIFISHTQQSGVDNARKLCQSLIDTVRRDYENTPPLPPPPIGFNPVPAFNTVPAGPASGAPYPLHPPGPYYDPPPGNYTMNYGPEHALPPPQSYHYPPPGPPPMMYSQPHPPTLRPPPPPNAFLDYRTYDKVEVSVASQSKRKFTEKEEESAPASQPGPDLGSKRKFTEDNPSASAKRRFTEDDNPAAPVKRKFSEGPPDKLPTADEEPPLVGKWQDMSQSITVKPGPKQPDNPEPKPKPTEKELMPPPSLPAGLKGLKSKGALPAVVRVPPSDPPNGGIPNKVDPQQSDHSGSNSTGLSLLSSYADDSSDSDND